MTSAGAEGTEGSSANGANTKARREGVGWIGMIAAAGFE